MTADLIWRGGSVPESARFGDVYYSLDSGLAESNYVFIGGNNLPERWAKTERFIVGELGFGTGLNFCTTLHEWRRSGKGRLSFLSFEKYPLARDDISRSLSVWPEIAEETEALLQRLPIPVEGVHRVNFDKWNTALTLVYGDARLTLGDITAQVDAWYLDGFAPTKNPELWGEDIFKQLARLSRAGASAATFSAARIVKDGLCSAGFTPIKRRGFGTKRDMLCAKLDSKKPSPESTSLGKAVIIGGGIAGISTAHALAKRGVSVVLFETEQRLAAGASGNPAGILMPHPAAEQTYRSRLSDAAYQYAFRLIKDLPLPIEFSDSGVLRLAAASSISKVIERADQFSFHALHAVRVDCAAASDIAGTKLKHNALHFPSAGWVSARDLCEGLAADCGERLQIRCCESILKLSRSEDEWQLLDRNGAILETSEVVIVAAGTSSTTFQQTSSLNIKAVRGQLAFAAPTEASSRLKIPVCHRGYILPARNGTHIIGATFEPDKYDDALSSENHEMLLQRTEQYLPQLQLDRSAPLGRVSFRAQSRDKLPLVGMVPNSDLLQQAYSKSDPKRPPTSYPEETRHPGLYVNTAHGSHGLSSAPLAAEHIASSMFGEPCALERALDDALDPARQLLRKYRQSA